MPGTFVLGRLLGVPLHINFSWLIIFVAVTYFLIAGQFPSRYPWWSPGAFVVAGLFTSLLFFGSVVLHELAHSVVARALGIPVHSITLFVFGGVAQVARDPAHPAGELLMAAVGPLTSLWLALFFAGVWAIARPLHEPTMAAAGWLAGLNLSLAIFNLLPGFPMDGGRVLRSLLWWATGSRGIATWIALAIARVLAWTFIAGGVSIAVTDYRHLVNGLWIAFIGWFLSQAVTGSARQARLMAALSGYTARDVMTSDLAWVAEEATLREVSEQHASRQPRLWFLVLRDGVLSGILGATEMARVPKRRWDEVTASDAMRPVGQMPLVSPAADAVDVLRQLEEGRIGHAGVISDGVLVGVVTQRSVFAAAGRWRWPR